MPSCQALQNRHPLKLCLHAFEFHMAMLFLKTLTSSATAKTAASTHKTEEPSLPDPSLPFSPPHLPAVPIFHHSSSTPSAVTLRCQAWHCVCVCYFLLQALSPTSPSGELLLLPMAQQENSTSTELTPQPRLSGLLSTTVKTLPFPVCLPLEDIRQSSIQTGLNWQSTFEGDIFIKWGF